MANKRDTDNSRGEEKPRREKKRQDNELGKPKQARKIHTCITSSHLVFTNFTRCTTVWSRGAFHARIASVTRIDTRASGCTVGVGVHACCPYTTGTYIYTYTYIFSLRTYVQANTEPEKTKSPVIHCNRGFPSTHQRV